MNKVDLNKKPTHATFMVYGPTRSGKTVLAATFPRPLFLADGIEQGWVSIQNMPAERFYESTIKPEVWAISSPKDMIEGIAEASKIITSQPGKFQTLVIDSLTFYADLFWDAIKKLGGARFDTRKGYGDLKDHLRSVMIQAHSLPVNVVWLALDKEAEAGKDNSIALAGSSAKTLPAAVQYFLCQKATREGTDAIKYETHTRRFGDYTAGGRDYGRLPDILPDSSYRAFATAIGWL